MESFAQPTSVEADSVSVSGSQPTVFHFEALRQSLQLPLTTLVDDALNFQIGRDMKVTALMSDGGRCLLLVELIETALLMVEDWQRLEMHLSSHFDDERTGCLVVLDDKLSVLWSHSAEMTPDQWVQEARRVMLWCLGARELVGRHCSPAHR